MIRSFKQAQVAAGSVMALSLVVAVAIWFRDTGHPFFVPLIGSVLMLGIGYFSGRVLGNLVASSQNTHLLGYLHMELDPEKFVENYREIPGKMSPASSSAAICRSYLADGYAAAGDFSMALKTLEDGEPPRELSVQGLYASNRCAYYLGLEDAPKVKEAMAQLDRIIDSCRLKNSALANNLQASLELYHQGYLCLTGKPASSAFLEDAFQRAQYNLRRLDIAKIQAMAALNAGDQAETRKHLTYLRKNSGKTYYKAWADRH